MRWKKILGWTIVIAFFVLIWGMLAFSFGSGLLAAAVLLAAAGISILVAVGIFLIQDGGGET